MLQQLSRPVAKFVVMAALLILLGGTFGASTAQAAQHPGGPDPSSPQITECQFVHSVDKYAASGQQSGGNYTLTIAVRFFYDNYFSHGLCWTQGVAILNEGANTVGGTLSVLLVYGSQTDSASGSVAGGGPSGATRTVGTDIHYTTCGEASGSWAASSGFKIPSVGALDSGNQCG